MTVLVHLNSAKLVISGAVVRYNSSFSMVTLNDHLSNLFVV